MIFKRQFFIFGASVAYGVGGTQGGWSGLLKSYIHGQLYGESALGEQMEVYNFAKPGAEISFVLENFPWQLKAYQRNSPRTVFMSVGLNNTKAVGHPENYVADEEGFEKQYCQLLDKMSEAFETINILGFYELDEKKVSPKINPFDGLKTYFNNERIFKFNEVLKQLCSQYSNVNFIDLQNLAENWLEKDLFEDGIHPNDKGHQLIFEALKPYVKM